MKLFNLFKESPKVTSETEVMEVANTGYPQIVQDIHNEFMNAGDILLSQAKSIINNLKITNEQKANQLASLGFSSVKEVTEAEEVKSKRLAQEKIAEAITDMQRDFPNNKIITEDIIDGICTRYGLVFGEVSQYKGFVPQKNANDIARFYKNHPDEEMEYTKTSIHGWRRSDTEVISKKEYEDHLAHEKTKSEFGMYFPSTYYYRERNPVLNICAPLKDMNAEGYSLKGNRLIKDIPDPIVTKLKIHKNGTRCHIILTAWGDEASDPEIINERSN